MLLLLPLGIPCYYTLHDVEVCILCQIMATKHSLILQVAPISKTTRAPSTIIGSPQLSALLNILPRILRWRLVRVSFDLSSQAAMPS